MLPHIMGALPDVRKGSENRVVSEVKKIMNRKKTVQSGIISEITLLCIS